jgi:hypothetical protein
MGKLIQGLLDTNGMGGVLFSAGDINTTLPNAKPMSQRRTAKERAFTALFGIVLAPCSEAQQ